MVVADLKIKCWKCGKEEEIRQILEDSTVDVNLDKICPICTSAWMTKKELTLRKYDAPNQKRITGKNIFTRCLTIVAMMISDIPVI